MISDEIMELKLRAEEYRYYYQIGEIDIKEAKDNIMPYINKVNEKSIEIAKNIIKKPRKVTFKSFCRY